MVLASGSLCLSPLLILTCAIGHPFTNNEKLPLHTHNFIQSLHFSINPTILNIYSRKLQLTESYTFSKSTLHYLFRRFVRSTVSLTTTTPSDNNLPLMNVNLILRDNRIHHHLMPNLLLTLQIKTYTRFLIEKSIGNHQFDRCKIFGDQCDRI
jgi:hypothetical protein